MPTANQLEAADQAAQQQSAGQRIDDSVMACPLRQRYAIEVTVVGEDDRPLADIGVELGRAADAVLRDKTGAAGLVRFDGLQTGGHTLSLYELDRDAWELVSSAPLPAGAAASSGDAVWQAPAAPAACPPAHTVAQGESISSIAQLHGHLPDSLWECAANSALKNERASKDVLYPGDTVHLPAPRRAEVAAQVRQAYRLRRKGVPALFSVRFVDSALAPRTGLPYVCDVDNARGQILPRQSGTTDGDGAIRAGVPLDATRAHVRLTTDAGEELHTFLLGHMDPVDTDSGVQARLVNLRYLRIDPERDLAADTRAALLRFQHEQGLAETGAADDATRAALRQTHMS
jgi:hypothetical protein